jgi:hypothetical protein
LSVDPDVAATGQPYAFVGDDPVNGTDPLGLYQSAGGNGGGCNTSSGGTIYCYGGNGSGESNAGSYNPTTAAATGAFSPVMEVSDEAAETTKPAAAASLNTNQLTGGNPLTGVESSYDDLIHSVNSLAGATSVNNFVNSNINNLSCVGKGIIVSLSPTGLGVANSGAPSLRYLLTSLGYDGEMLVKDEPVGWVVTAALAAGGCKIPGFRLF